MNIEAKVFVPKRPVPQTDSFNTSAIPFIPKYASNPPVETVMSREETRIAELEAQNIILLEQIATASTQISIRDERIRVLDSEWHSMKHDVTIISNRFLELNAQNTILLQENDAASTQISIRDEKIKKIENSHSSIKGTNAKLNKTIHELEEANKTLILQFKQNDQENKTLLAKQYMLLGEYEIKISNYKKKIASNIIGHAIHLWLLRRRTEKQMAIEKNTRRNFVFKHILGGHMVLPYKLTPLEQMSFFLAFHHIPTEEVIEVVIKRPVSDVKISAPKGIMLNVLQNHGIFFG